MFILQAGLLTTVIQELCDLVSELSSGDYSNSSVSVTDLEIELHRAQEAVDRMTKDLDAKSEELKRRGETIMELTSKVYILILIVDFNRLTTFVVMERLC